MGILSIVMTFVSDSDVFDVAGDLESTEYARNLHELPIISTKLS
jgi:hypothetical protein